MTASDILSKLDGVRGSNGNWTARCPSHDDQHNSLKVSLKGDRLLLHCHAGCSTQAIVSALGIEMADLFPPRPANAAPPPPAGPARRILATYDYTDETGTLLFQCVRYEPKDFRQRRPDGQGGWIWNLSGIEPVLYRLPYLAMAVPGDQVFVCAGEKDADNLAALGLMATSAPMGEGRGKWRESFNRWLAGMHIILLEDNDATGRAHVEDVARQLHGTAASVKVVTFRHLPEHGDVSDWLDGPEGYGKDELLKVVELTPLWQPPASATIVAFPGPELAQAEFRRLSVNAWEFRPAALPPLRLVARRVTGHREEIGAWFEGTWNGPGGGPLFHDHVNFGSSTMASTVAKNASRCDGLSPDELLEQIRTFKRLVIEAHFTAAQISDLSVPLEHGQCPPIVDGLIPGGVPTWLYGGRGSAKTLFSLYLLTCTYYGLPVLGYTVPKAVGMLCEWEETSRDVRPVLARIAKGLDVDVPRIPHLWCAGAPLRHQVDQLAAAREEYGASYGVFDSVLAAVGASGEYTSNADGVTMLMEAVNSLGSDFGSILVDHINQDDLKNQRDADPRDSGRKLDAARAGYQIQRLAKENGSMRLKIRQAKSPMNAPPIEPIGVLIRWFQDGAITFDQTDDLSKAEHDGESDAHRAAIADALRTTQQATPAELAMLCNLPSNIVRARLTDDAGKRLFDRVSRGYYTLRRTA